MTYKQLNCCRCEATFFLPPELYKSARASDQISFYCPYGHAQHFSMGETEADKLRRERDQLRQEKARLYDEIRLERAEREAAERRVSAARGQVTKLKKRASAGVCPCCNRTFENLKRHMNTKHPEFSAPEALKVITGGKA